MVLRTRPTAPGGDGSLCDCPHSLFEPRCAVGLRGTWAAGQCAPCPSVTWTWAQGPLGWTKGLQVHVPRIQSSAYGSPFWPWARTITLCFPLKSTRLGYFFFFFAYINLLSDCFPKTLSEP